MRRVPSSYLPQCSHEGRLPVKNGLLDWDSADALDISAMTEALSYIRQHASFPVLAPHRLTFVAKS